MNQDEYNAKLSEFDPFMKYCEPHMPDPSAEFEEFLISLMDMPMLVIYEFGTHIVSLMTGRITGTWVSEFSSNWFNIEVPAALPEGFDPKQVDVDELLTILSKAKAENEKLVMPDTDSHFSIN